MEELNELTSIIRQKGQRSIQLVNQNFRKKEKSKDNILYDLILSEKINCDEKAAKLLFNTDPANRNFRNAKLKLRQKLLNHLFFLDYGKSNNSQYVKIEYECLLKLSQYKILIMEGQQGMVLKRIPALIKTALEYDLVEIALECLLILRNEYSKLGKYNPQMESERQIQNLRPLHKSIIDSEALFYDTMVIINKSNNSRVKIKDSIPDRIKLIKEEAQRFNNRRLDILSKLLAIYYHRICHRDEMVIEICNDLEESYIPLDVSKIKVNINASYIAEVKLEALYRINDTKVFRNYCRQKIGLFKPGSEKWMAFMENWLLLFMKSGEFEQSANIFKKVKSNAAFSHLDEITVERWMIYRAYLCFVTQCKEIQWGFNLAKYTDIKNISSGHNDSLNTANLIIRFLFNLRNGNIPAVRECLDKLKNYSSFHLDKRRNYRNSIFIRMLEIIVTNNFDYNLIDEKVTIYYNKLKNNKVKSEFRDELEVIPFDQLWEIIMGILQTNKHYLHFRFYHHTEVELT